MGVEIVTKEDLHAFRIQLIDDLRKLLKECNSVPVKTWLRSKEVRAILNISPGTLQNLRVTDKLHPVKVGGILYYKLEEVNSLLDV